MKTSYEIRIGFLLIYNQKMTILFDLMVFRFPQ